MGCWNGKIKMKAILVFIDGTICDTRPRHALAGSPDFYQPERILEDAAVPGSAECLQALSRRYKLVYTGARPEWTLPATSAWLEKNGFPKGPVALAESQESRLALVKEMAGRYDFLAGIGDRWDDNLLHTELGCLSIILEEFAGRWGEVFERIDRWHRRWKIDENRIHLQGKVEGLARVCPLLLSKYGDGLWEAYFNSVMEMAERTRQERREEDLASFASHGLDPADLRDAAKWDDVLREEDWENNPVYGMQEFELVEAARNRYVHRVTRCYYADLWKAYGRPDIGYQIHCRTDTAWWDRPAWNPEVRFQQPETLMQGHGCCLFVMALPYGEQE